MKPANTELSGFQPQKKFSFRLVGFHVLSRDVAEGYHVSHCVRQQSRSTAPAQILLPAYL